MSAPCVHHVGIGVLDEKPMLRLFQQKLGFSLLCTRRTSFDEKWVLSKNNVKFVLTKLVESETASLQGIASASSSLSSSSSSSSLRPSTTATGDGGGHQRTVGEDGGVNHCDYSPPTRDWNRNGNASNNFGDTLSSSSSCSTCPNFSTRWNQPGLDDDTYPTDCLSQICTNNSVYEVCLEVGNVSKLLDRAVSAGVKVLKPLTVAKSSEGEVTYATIRSCVGNVQHTFVNTDKYNGKFLPGFEDCSNAADDYRHADPLNSLNIDHITLCVPPQHTIETLAWYQNCFGMHRLIVNRNEDSEKGLMLNDIQLRMAAMEYWHCSESGLSFAADTTSVKFVVVESLSDAPNQVSTFLKHHGGPGIQHIGFSIHRLIDGLEQLKRVGVEFLQPPKEYYNEIGKLKEIEDCGESVALLERCGILLDSEADCSVETSQSDLDDPQSRYLMQTFTKPIFGDDTFFLEFLQRHGALGFGAGNITALWRAVKQYMEKHASN